jgi:hypothetical protein
MQINFSLQMIKEGLSLNDLLPKVNSRVGYKTRKAFIPFCWNSITFPCIENGLVVDCTSHIIFTNVVKLSKHQEQV